MIRTKILSELKQLAIKTATLETLLKFVIPTALVQFIVALFVGAAINQNTIALNYQIRSDYVDRAYQCVIDKREIPTIKVIQNRDCAQDVNRITRLFESGFVDKFDTALNNMNVEVSDVFFLNTDKLKQLEEAKWDLIIKSLEIGYEDEAETATDEEKEENENILKTLNTIKADSIKALDSVIFGYMLILFPIVFVYWLVMSIISFVIRRTAKAE